MAMASAKVNKHGLAAPHLLSARWFCVWLCMFSAQCLNFATARNDTTSAFVPVNGTCTHNMTLEAGSQKPMPPEALRDLPETTTNATFDVKACSDVHVILYAIAPTASPRADVIDIVLGENNQSAIQNCSSTSNDCVRLNGTDGNPLSCNESRRFFVSWQDSVQVHIEEEGAWNIFLNYTPETELHVHNVFVAYTGEENRTAEWKIDIPCPSDSDGGCPPQAFDMSPFVTRGHLAGSVVAALIAGIIIGVIGVFYGPKVFKFLRDHLERFIPERWRQNKKGEADQQREAEMETLMVQPSSPDKPSTPARSNIEETEDPEKAIPILPGERLIVSSGPPSRKTSNAYTPYHEMGGGQGKPVAKKPSGGASKPDAAQKTATPVPAGTPKTGGVRKGSNAGKTDAPPKAGGGDGQKPSGAGRALSPLPPLPGDPAAAAATESEDTYINADAHVYEGMRHDTPIYENRNVGLYESLKPTKSKDDQK